MSVTSKKIKIVFKVSLLVVAFWPFQTSVTASQVQPYSDMENIATQMSSNLTLGKSFEESIYEMAPTGMTIILTVLILMSFCVVCVMCINCFLGTCAECKKNGSSVTSSNHPAESLQVL